MNVCQQQVAKSKICQANIVGPQIRKWRCARNWSQAKLAIELQLKGLDFDRCVVAQIESQIHCVKDIQLPYFARALGINLVDLFPPSTMDGISGKIVTFHLVQKFAPPQQVVMKS